MFHKNTFGAFQKTNVYVFQCTENLHWAFSLCRRFSLADMLGRLCNITFEGQTKSAVI